MKASYTREFIAYATAQGRLPDAQIEHDKAQYPGGCMCGFILWMSQKLTAFKRRHPEHCVGDIISDHDAKCAFLEASP